MRIRHLDKWLLFLACIGPCTACTALEHRAVPLRVIAMHVPGAAHYQDDAIQLRFDGPAVGLEEVGEPLAVTPVAIQPALALATYWTDRQTLVMRPLQPLRPATRYSIELRGPLRERFAPQPTLEFTHRPPSASLAVH